MFNLELKEKDAFFIGEFVTNGGDVSSGVSLQMAANDSHLIDLGGDRLTIQKAGKYHIMARALLNNSASTTVWYFSLKVNGWAKKNGYIVGEHFGDVSVEMAGNFKVGDVISFEFLKRSTHNALILWGSSHSLITVIAI